MTTCVSKAIPQRVARLEALTEVLAGEIALSMISVPSIAALEALPPQTGTVLVQGYTGPGTGGGGTFYWDGASVATPDNGTIFPGAAGIGSPGRFIRLAATGSLAFTDWFGGSPNAKFFNNANGRWYQNSTLVAEASDYAVQVRRARDYLVGLAQLGGNMLLPAGNLYVGASFEGPHNEIILLTQGNMTISGAGIQATVFRVRGGTTTGGTSYSTIFGMGQLSAGVSVDNLEVFGVGFDHNSQFNQWAGPNFNGLGVLAETGSVLIPAGNNVHIHDVETFNHNGVFVYLVGTYQFPNLAYNFSIRNTKLRVMAQDPNMGDCSWISVGATNGLVDGNQCDVGSNAGGGIVSVVNNGAGLIRVVTANPHGLGPTAGTNSDVVIQGVTGTTEANSQWTVTVINPTTIDLQGSAFVHAYTGGGQVDACRGSTHIECHGVDVTVSNSNSRGVSVAVTLVADSADSYNLRAINNTADEVQEGVGVIAILGKKLEGFQVIGNYSRIRNGGGVTAGERAIAVSNGGAFGIGFGAGLFNGQVHDNQGVFTYGTPSGGAGFGSYGMWVVAGNTNCSFKNNTFTGFGALGIKFESVTGAGQAQNMVTNATITGNKLINNGLGGISINGFGEATPFFLNMIITNNESEFTGGGANYGVIFSAFGDSNCVFWNNPTKGAVIADQQVTTAVANTPTWPSDTTSGTLTNLDAALTVAGGNRYILSAGTLSRSPTYTLGTAGAATDETIEIIRYDNSANSITITNGGGGGGTAYTFPASAKRRAVFRYDGANWALLETTAAALASWH